MVVDVGGTDPNVTTLHQGMVVVKIGIGFKKRGWF
jgi:hypothetical protein